MSATLFGLAQCGAPPKRSFPPIHYAQSAALRLNVAQIQVLDRATSYHSPGDIAYKSPLNPDASIHALIAHRFLAGGPSGIATFTIDRATILHAPGGILRGRMDVRLEVKTSDGDAAGFAAAHIRRSYIPANGHVESRANLYIISLQMVRDLDHELERQIRKNLGDWLLDASGAPLQSSVAAQNLAAPAVTTVTTLTPPNSSLQPSATPRAKAPISSKKTLDDTPSAVFPLGEP